ncbi:MAG: HEPN domain-containing protein [Alphaproteobacteria bacterium]|nr:HEPN domain-containing protein [Alphaproteobacteria bacterium]
MNWIDYYDIANQSLSAEKEKEAHYRSAISRAYYAVYNTYKTLTTDFKNRNRVSHAECWDFFENDKNDQLSEIGKTARALRDWRNDSDYDNSLKISKENAEDVLEDALELIEQFETAKTTINKTIQ